MTAELKELGLQIGHRPVGRLMRQNNISVIRTRNTMIMEANIAAMIIRSCYGNLALKYPCQEREIVMTMQQWKHSALGWKSPI